MKRKRLCILTVVMMILAVALTMGGCGEKDTSTVGYALRDDGEIPAQPQDLSSIVNNVYTGYMSSANTYFFRVKISWKKVTTNYKGEAKENIIGYKIYRDGRGDSSLLGMVGPNTTTFTDASESLEDGSVHYYYVSAFDSYMRESTSTSLPVKIEIDGAIPNAPRDVTIISGNHSLTLAWEEPLPSSDPQLEDDMVVGYKIMRRTDTDKSYQDYAIVMNTTYFHDGSLTEGERYYYTIKSLTKKGNESKPTIEKSWTVSNVSTDDGYAPMAPESPSVTIAGTKAMVTWSKPLFDDNGTGMDAANVRGYYVYRGDGGGMMKLVKVLDNRVSWDDEKIDATRAAGYYRYQISAFDDSGNEGDRTPEFTNNGIALPDTVKTFELQLEQSTQHVYLKWTYQDNMRYSIYSSLNGKYYTVHEANYNPNPTPVSDPYNAGHSTAHNTQVQYDYGRIQNDRIYYFKISAVSMSTGKESNKSFFRRVSRSSEFIDASYTLQAESVSSQIDVRFIAAAAGYTNTTPADDYAGTGAQADWALYWNDRRARANYNYTLNAMTVAVGATNVSTLIFNPYKSDETSPVSGVTWPYTDGQKYYSWSGDGSATAVIPVTSDANEHVQILDQFRIPWQPSISGTYDIKFYFVRTQDSGTYNIVIRDNSSVYVSGTPISLNGTTNEMTDPSTEASFSGLNFTSGKTVYFVFCCTGAALSDIQNCKLYIDRIEIERRD